MFRLQGNRSALMNGVRPATIDNRKLKFIGRACGVG
jgi:hypothetical protein